MLTLILSLFIYLGMIMAARAYQITTPSDLESSGPSWTSTGPNIIIWQKVSTDTDSFAIVLVNENRSVMPNNNQLLAASVDGAGLSIAVSPTNGQTFPTGSGFRVNFIKSASEMNFIYAQSSQFRIASDGQGVTNAGGSAVSMPSTMAQDVSTGRNTTPRTTYIAPVQTETITITMASSSRIGPTLERWLMVLGYGSCLLTLVVWITFV